MQDDDSGDFDSAALLGGFDEPPEINPRNEDELVFSFEVLIADEDIRGRDELGLSITDSNVNPPCARRWAC
ncbi:MAG: hypothetical protein WD342_20900 [Verrucomicrobiales bacterium]